MAAAASNAGALGSMGVGATNADGAAKMMRADLQEPWAPEIDAIRRHMLAARVGLAHVMAHRPPMMPQHPAGHRNPPRLHFPECPLPDVMLLDAALRVPPESDRMMAD